MAEREEQTLVLRIQDPKLGVVRRRVRILQEITVDDIMENAIKAQAMLVRRGKGKAPEYGRGITDYLLSRGRLL